MCARSIFLLLFAIAAVKSYSYVDDTASVLYNRLIHTSITSNDSVLNRRFLPSFDSSVKVYGVKYYFTPEPIGFAAYDHPQSLNLSGYNSTCLDSWSRTYEQNIANCSERYKNDMQSALLCNITSRSSDVCETRKIRSWDCIKTAFFVDKRMEEISFPDGRSINLVLWNCSAFEDCDKLGCKPKFSYHIYPVTTATVVTSDAFVFKIMFGIGMLFLIVGFGHILARHRQKMRSVQDISQAGAIPTKGAFISFPPPTVLQPNQYSQPPPSYFGPPPYSEKPIDLPKVA